MGTKYQGTKSEVRALNAFIALTRATNSVLATLTRRRAYGDLSVTQFGALEALYHLGPLPQHRLAKKLLKSGGNIVTVIDNLERRGLVQRVRLERDRRVVEVSLTDEARQLIEATFPKHVDDIVAALGALDAREQAALTRLCKTLGLGQAEIPAWNEDDEGIE